MTKVVDGRASLRDGVTMTDEVTRALARGGGVEITTTGRRSGQQRRVRLAFHNVGGRVYLSGRPGFPRSWVANLRAQPSFTFHLRGAVRADLPARGRVITDRAERVQIIPAIAAGWGYDPAIMVAGSPLVEVTFDD
ncbi:MAG: nitroreductase/quinone reductase family protein [Candidatus Limnocylindria bacterium]